MKALNTTNFLNSSTLLTGLLQQKKKKDKKWLRPILVFCENKTM